MDSISVCLFEPVWNGILETFAHETCSYSSLKSDSTSHTCLNGFCGWNCAWRKPTISFPLLKPNPDRLSPTAFDWSSHRVYDRYEIVWTRTAKPVFTPNQTRSNPVSYPRHRLVLSPPKGQSVDQHCGLVFRLVMTDEFKSTFSLADQSSSFWPYINICST